MSVGLLRLEAPLHVGVCRIDERPVRVPVHTGLDRRRSRDRASKSQKLIHINCATPKPLLPYPVAKRHHTARVGLDFHEVQADIPVELFEERDPLTYQDGHDRIAHFVG